MDFLIESYLNGNGLPYLGSRVRCGSDSFVYVGTAVIEGGSRPVILPIEQVSNSLDENLDFYVLEEGYDLCWISDHPPYSAHVRRLQDVVVQELVTDMTWPSKTPYRASISIADSIKVDSFRPGDVVSFDGDSCNYLYCGQYKGVWILACTEEPKSHMIGSKVIDGTDWKICLCEPKEGWLNGNRMNVDIAHSLHRYATSKPVPGSSVFVSGLGNGIWLMDDFSVGLVNFIAVFDDGSPEFANKIERFDVARSVYLGEQTCFVVAVSSEIVSLRNFPTIRTLRLADKVLSSVGPFDPGRRPSPSGPVYPLR